MITYWRFIYYKGEEYVFPGNQRLSESLDNQWFVLDDIIAVWTMKNSLLFLKEGNLYISDPFIMFH
jgi:hypothetical protein